MQSSSLCGILHNLDLTCRLRKVSECVLSLPLIHSLSLCPSPFLPIPSPHYCPSYHRAFLSYLLFLGQAWKLNILLS